MTIWVPVVAALGASLLTIIGTFGLQAYRDGGAKQDQRRLERRDAYAQLLATSMTVAYLGGVHHLAMQLRSGLGEGIDIALRIRRPLDPFELGELNLRYLQPLNEAWAHIWAIGSPDAVKAGNSVVDKCAAYFGVVSELGKARTGPWARFRSSKWTPEQVRKQEAALRELAVARKELAEVTRRELGSLPAQLFLEGGPPRLSA